jgi:hypothetical protein
VVPSTPPGRGSDPLGVNSSGVVAKGCWRRSTVYGQFQWALAGGVAAASVAAPPTGEAYRCGLLAVRSSVVVGAGRYPAAACRSRSPTDDVAVLCAICFPPGRSPSAPVCGIFSDWVSIIRLAKRGPDGARRRMDLDILAKVSAVTRPRGHHHHSGGTRYRSDQCVESARTAVSYTKITDAAAAQRCHRRSPGCGVGACLRPPGGSSSRNVRDRASRPAR